MHAKCREVSDTYKMFDTMPDKDMASWNALIAGYAKMALELFMRMQENFTSSAQFQSLIQ